MRTELLLPLLIIVLIILNLYNRYQRVYVADAGPTKELTALGQIVKNFFMPYQNARLEDGSLVNTHEFIRVLVDGKCMEPRGIMDKSHVLVQRIMCDKDFKEQVNIGDVLLLRLHDKKVYKLRILNNFDDINQLETYRYQNGRPHRSSRNHNPKDVIGIVRYIVN